MQIRPYLDETIHTHDLLNSKPYIPMLGQKNMPRDKSMQDMILNILNSCKEGNESHLSEAHGISPTKTPRGLDTLSKCKTKPVKLLKVKLKLDKTET